MIGTAHPDSKQSRSHAAVTIGTPHSCAFSHFSPEILEQTKCDLLRLKDSLYLPPSSLITSIANRRSSELTSYCEIENESSLKSASGNRDWHALL